MFELFCDIYFVVYKLYYVGQNDNLGIRVSLMNWDRGSMSFRNRLHKSCTVTNKSIINRGRFYKFGFKERFLFIFEKENTITIDIYHVHF
jgi:hypothetical protein